MPLSFFQREGSIRDSSKNPSSKTGLRVCANRAEKSTSVVEKIHVSRNEIPLDVREIDFGARRCSRRARVEAVKCDLTRAAAISVSVIQPR